MSGLEPGPFTWVLNEEDLGQLQEAIMVSQEVIWDTETTGLIGTSYEGGPTNGGVGARQSLATFTLPMPDSDGYWDGVDPTTWILPLSHPDSPWLGNWREISRDLAALMLRNRKPLSGHNIKFDMKYQAQAVGGNLVPIMEWDTVDGCRLLEQGLSAKLGDAAPRAFPGLESWKDFDLSQPGASERIPLMELGSYGARDTYWCWRLKRYQQERMFLLPDSGEPEDSEEIIDANAGRLAVWVAMPTVASLTQIELNAFKLDVEMTERLLEESRRISAEALDKIAHLYIEDHELGLVDLDPEHCSVAPTSHWFGRLTQHAVQKKDLQILSLTPKGKPQWTKSVLNKLAMRAGEDSVAALILEQRHHSKRAEFLSSWLSYVTDDGKISASYNTGMATGRLSSSGPNMQQITKKLRPCFIPDDEDWVVADFDFSQIELRVAAFISRCLPMLEAFREGKDLHNLLAAEVTVQEPEDVSDEERQKAKAVNFGLLFGLGVFGLKGYAEDSYGVTMTQDEAQNFYYAYFRKWAGLEEWHQRVEARLQRDGRSISPLGRVRNFRNAGGGDRNAAINAPVQGMASDLMQIAIADIQGLLPAQSGRGRVEGVRVVGTVHDSAVVLLPRDNWEAKAREIQERMEDINPLLAYMGVELDVPIKIEAQIGSRWSLKDIGEIK